MKQVSFIHMADLHLDASFSSLGDADKAGIRRDELQNCLRSIVEKVQTQNVDLLLISGDFFEDSNVKGSTILTAKNLFSELYKTEIIICPGNHDPLKENSYYKASEWGSNVHILEDSGQVLYLEKYNTCIYNLGARGDVCKDYPIILDKDILSQRFNILLFHGTVDIPFEEDNYNSISSKEIFSLGMDYVALGHMHRYSKIQSGKTVMINPGSPEPLGFDEEGIHGFSQGRIMVAEDNQKSVEAEFIPYAIRHYHNLDVNINDCTSDEEVIAKMRLAGQINFSSMDLYCITLKGFIPMEYKLGVKNILEAFEQSCFFIKIKNQTSIQFEYEQYLEDPGIKGEFVRRIMDMIDSETSAARHETLYMALQYGLQALENGRVDQ
ncbi:MAG: metallophosphoesterase family protein [Ruminiclostridium sp.]